MALRGPLDARWLKSKESGERLMYGRLTLLLVGIALEVVFVAINLPAMKNKTSDPQLIRIEIPLLRDSIVVLEDSTHHLNLEVKITH